MSQIIKRAGGTSVITATAPITNGQVLLVGGAAKTLVIAMNNAAIGEDVAVKRGPFVAGLPKVTGGSGAFDFGDEVYWDLSAGLCTSVVGADNYLIGTCDEKAGVLAATASMDVHCTGAPAVQNSASG